MTLTVAKDETNIVDGLYETSYDKSMGCLYLSVKTI